MPFRFLLSLPGDVLGGLRQLPRLVSDIGRIADATLALPGILVSTEKMAADTDVLAQIRDDMAGVAESTKVLDGMDQRMAAIEAAMPMLVEVQQHLARLPETIGGLDRGVLSMDANLQGLLLSLEELSVNLNRLEGSVGPLGRLAGRVPGSRRAARKAQAVEAKANGAEADEATPSNPDD
jgi:hypothetical protein